MTFKHKLSCRLALLKDRVVLASLAGLVTAAIVACELPVRATDPGSTLADLLVSPKTLTLRQNATADFTAVGFMSTGDSASMAVSWSVTAGSIIDTSSNGKRHYGHYKAGPNPGQYKVVADRQPGRRIGHGGRHGDGGAGVRGECGADGGDHPDGRDYAAAGHDDRLPRQRFGGSHGDVGEQQDRKSVV